MSHIHFIGGEKGGVGKSFVSRLLAQYYIDSSRPFVGFDSDHSHQTFSRFYGDFSTPLQMSDFTSMDQIVVSAEENPEADIIVDMAAQTAKHFNEWVEETAAYDLLGLMGFQCFLWHVMDDGADSMNLLEGLLSRVSDDSIQLVVVENFGRGESFDLFEASDVFARAKARGAHFIKLHRLQSSIAQRVDFNSSSFWAAANNRDGLTTAERQRARVWMIKQYSQLQKLLKKSEALAAQSEGGTSSNNIISAKF